MKTIIHKITGGLTKISQYLVSFGPFGLLAIAFLDSLFIPMPGGVDAVLLLLAAFLLLRQSEAGLDWLAAGQITLLLAGIRNAWDMMIWIVIRAPTAEVGSRDDT